MKKVNFLSTLIAVTLLSAAAFAQTENAQFLNKDETMTAFNLNSEEMGTLDFPENPEFKDGVSMSVPAGSVIDVLATGQDQEGREYLKVLINKTMSAWVSQDELSEIETLEETAVAGPGFIQPARGRITGKPGMRRHPILKRMKYHAGTDIAAPTGTPVKAAADGIVTKSGWAGSYGILVEIRHAGGVVTRYAHLSKAIAKRNQRVTQGTVIGKVGSTGRSTGPHLHYEKR